MTLWSSEVIICTNTPVQVLMALTNPVFLNSATLYNQFSETVLAERTQAVLFTLTMLTVNNIVRKCY